ncbi:MAG TPA: ATP-binding cassette domain-containing protein [Burkholderiales bacterium]|nr:ATP-binding cassette domain-containing protein [Burkholderiales bacterium]
MQDASLKIERGGFFSPLGPSGCGEIATLRLIAAFETPDSGAVLYDGERRPLCAYADDANLVFRHYALSPHRTVERDVSFEVEKCPAAETQFYSIENIDGPVSIWTDLKAL